MLGARMALLQAFTKTQTQTHQRSFLKLLKIVYGNARVFLKTEVLLTPVCWFSRIKKCTLYIRIYVPFSETIFDYEIEFHI